MEALAGWPAVVNADAEDDDDRGGGGSFLDMMVWFGSYLNMGRALQQTGTEGNFRTRRRQLLGGTRPKSEHKMYWKYDAGWEKPAN